MRAPLTDVLVRSLKPPSRGSISVFDTSMRGLCLRISSAGTKSFCLVQGKKRTRTYIGKYPSISLATARSECKRIVSEQVLGVRSPRPSIRVAEAVRVFLEASSQKNKPRTVYDYRRLLGRHLTPPLGSRLLDSVGTRDIARIVDDLKSTPTEQNHAHSAIAIFLRWCARRGYIEVSPAEHLQLPARTKPRARVLSDAELAAVWECSTGVFGSIVRLCILLGQRRSEIAGLRWEWIDAERRLISFPAEHVKNNRSHTFPYGELAAEVLDATPMLGPYVFPARNASKQFSGWSQSKTRLDKAVSAAGYSVAPWTLHDLRRTFATNLAALAIPVHVTERLLNHVSGTVSGVAAIYNKFQYIDEMRDAVYRWEERLKRILHV
jgi:integrase